MGPPYLTAAVRRRPSRMDRATRSVSSDSISCTASRNADLISCTAPAPGQPGSDVVSCIFSGISDSVSCGRRTAFALLSSGFSPDGTECISPRFRVFQPGKSTIPSAFLSIFPGWNGSGQNSRESCPSRFWESRAGFSRSAGAYVCTGSCRTFVVSDPEACTTSSRISRFSVRDSTEVEVVTPPKSAGPCPALGSRTAGSVCTVSSRISPFSVPPLTVSAGDAGLSGPVSGPVIRGAAAGSASPPAVP